MDKLPAGAADELREAGFAIIPGPVAGGRLLRLARAYDAAMESGNAPDLKVGSTTTRLYDFLNRGPEFDELYTYPPLLDACYQVIGAPFKLSSTLGRTLRPHSHAQDLHVDIRRDSEDLPMAGFILTIDAFRPDNGATRFVPGSHRWPQAPEEVTRNLRTEYPGEVLACAPPGSLIIFNASVWHGHTANAAGEPRRSIQGYFVRRELRSGRDADCRVRRASLARTG